VRAGAAATDQEQLQHAEREREDRRDRRARHERRHDQRDRDGDADAGELQEVAQQRRAALRAVEVERVERERPRQRGDQAEHEHVGKRGGLVDQARPQRRHREQADEAESSDHQIEAEQKSVEQASTRSQHS
jgi:hypothetical protein